MNHKKNHKFFVFRKSFEDFLNETETPCLCCRFFITNRCKGIWPNEPCTGFKRW